MRRLGSGGVGLNVGVVFPTYPTVEDVPAGIEKGEVVYIDGDGLYVEDGT